jgi:CHAT domain-containing protein/Tfp pilus assembly protein PilF
MRRLWLTVLAVIVVAAVVGRTPAQAPRGKAEVDALYQRAEALKEAGKWREAIGLYEKAVDRARTVFDPQSVEVASLEYNLASLYRITGQHARAEPLFRSSLRIREASLPRDHFLVAQPLSGLALVYQDLGQYRRAEPLLQRCLKITEAGRGENHPETAACLGLLAGLYQDMGQYARALPLLQRRLAIYERKWGKNHSDVATALNDLALLYHALGQYEKALPLLQRSLAIDKTSGRGDHPNTATTLNNLAMVLVALGQPARALPLYKRSLQIREERLGKDHADVAASLNNLAGLYQGMSQYGKALPLYQRSLAIKESRWGKDHPDVANSLNNLAVLYRYLDQHDKAGPLYQRSLKIWESSLGKDHPCVTDCLSSMASLCARQGRSKESARLFERARRGALRHITAVLPVLSEPEKAAFFENTRVRSNLDLALSLGLLHRTDATVARRSAGWLLNAKALIQEGLASSELLARQSNDPDVGKLATQLLSARQKLARQSMSAVLPGQQQQHRERIEQLSDREQELGRRLRQAGSKAALPAWVELADARKHLPAGTVLIDVARFQVFDFKAKRGKRWQEARYVAWVTAKTGSVSIVDLGPAGRIDDAVKRFREAIKGAARRLKDSGEAKAEKSLRKQLDELSKLVLEPLLPHVGKSKRWLVCPDGNLWLLPWETLTLSDGKYTIEKYHIGYLTSGRDLLPSVAAKVKVTAPLVLADPDFDLDPKKARAEARRLLARSVSEENTRSLAVAPRPGQVRRLAGTAAEAKAITPSLKAYAGVAPRVHTRSEALEAVFKATRNPRVVVLCTHGFFLPDQETPRDGRGGVGKPKPAKRWQNPLLRCGLLLAGCNNAARATEGDDGILTGLEVLGTDLRGCELVVLSACDTGVGTVQTGEGVSGVRQAFQLAGAQAVVSTLWQVPDRSSARLMSLFFKNLSKKMSKAEALRAAKLKLIEERREDYGAAHPFFWAAFTLTGQ